MIKSFLTFQLLILFCTICNAQVLDSVRFRTSQIDTLIFVTQQDVDEYVVLRKITDTIGKLEGYIRILKNTKQVLAYGSPTTYERALQFSERSEKFKTEFNKKITPTDITEYLSIRKISSDTTGKTTDYIKIIKSAKMRVAMGDFSTGLYKPVDYETALNEAEENFRLKSMVDKVLVIKSERKMYLQKKGKTVKTYAIGLSPNPVGQKEYEGDGKTPEGIYHLDYQKWDSPTFHSFHISYPNDKDLARAKTKGLTAGSNIMIHGTSKKIKKKKDWTNGCIALNNTDMAEFRKIVFLDTPVEIRK